MKPSRRSRYKNARRRQSRYKNAHNHRTFDDHVEHLRARLGDLRELVGVPAGKRLIRCPTLTHEDNHPSCSLYKDRDGRERWKCHGCGEGGDVIDLAAALCGMSTADYIRERSPKLPVRLPPKAPKPQGPPRPPRPDPATRRAVGALWQECLEEVRSDSAAARGTRSYLRQRLGEEVANLAIEAGLVGALPSAASWAGRRLWGPWKLVSPLYEVVPVTESVIDEDELPVDLARRSMDLKTPKDKRVKGLYKACHGVTKTFGRVSQALLEADDDELIIIEGHLNWVAQRLTRYGERVIGLHGAGSAARVANSIVDEVRFLRSQGVQGPNRVRIDTDRDRHGNEAAKAIALAFSNLDIKCQRVGRKEGHREVA